MSTCARCGLQRAQVWPGTSGVNPSVCYVDVTKGTGEHDWVALDCRDRELANLRSLLRSVTGKLERVQETLSAPSISIPDQQHALDLVESVLEALS